MLAALDDVGLGGMERDEMQKMKGNGLWQKS